LLERDRSQRDPLRAGEYPLRPARDLCASIAGWDALSLHLAAAATRSASSPRRRCRQAEPRMRSSLRAARRLMGEARNGSMLALVGASVEDARAPRSAASRW
jgi:hypothetical protein